MSGQAYERFFLQPSDPIHRRYETLRAVFVDKQPMKEVAGRFDVHYGTVRNWVSEFRARQETQQPPLFFLAPQHGRGFPRRWPERIRRCASAVLRDRTTLGHAPRRYLFVPAVVGGFAV